MNPTRGDDFQEYGGCQPPFDAVESDWDGEGGLPVDLDSELALPGLCECCQAPAPPDDGTPFDEARPAAGRAAERVNAGRKSALGFWGSESVLVVHNVTREPLRIDVEADVFTVGNQPPTHVTMQYLVSGQVGDTWIELEKHWFSQGDNRHWIGHLNLNVQRTVTGYPAGWFIHPLTVKDDLAFKYYTLRVDVLPQG
jgi:hypothetical protein